ncbi:Thialysine N-epsilon-acetyltransferase [Geodia barretti]|uniref:Thialysine N-epsilon-acetyltransferase n=1 Tax=Geodia barretti TaxID=519541 RepID=A0AA35WCF7_GEOBA|nr:Thialysine N-epsilon-acetyltransferase [Geodia barretti]
MACSHPWKIRPATREDVPSIVWLTQVLAEYENEPRSMKIGEKEMLRDGFGEKQYFHVLVAEWTSDDGPVLNSIPVDPEKPSTSMPHNDRIVGHALYFYTYSTWEGKCLHMEDLCVREQYRNRGIGTALMQECAKVSMLQRICKNATFGFP